MFWEGLLEGAHKVPESRVFTGSRVSSSRCAQGHYDATEVELVSPTPQPEISTVCRSLNSTPTSPEPNKKTQYIHRYMYNPQNPV